MTLSFVKSKLQNALIRFGYGILFSTLISLLIIVYADSYWVLGFTVSILLFSVTGAIINARSTVKLTAIEKESFELDKETYINNIGNSMIGSIGMCWMFFTLVVLIYTITYVTLIYFGVPVFYSRLSFTWSFISLVLLIYIEYKVIHQLSFSLLYISFIYSFLNENKFSNKSNNVLRDEIKSLIIKYYSYSEKKEADVYKIVIDDLKNIYKVDIEKKH